MNEQYPSIKLFGLSFNLTNDIGVLVSAVLVFLLVFWLSRNLKMRPGGKQNVLEWIMDFTNGIVKGTMPGSERYTFNLFAFTLFLFIFISNQIGLFIEVDIGKDTWFRSATASPVITMTLAMMVLVLSHYFGLSSRVSKDISRGMRHRSQSCFRSTCLKSLQISLHSPCGCMGIFSPAKS